MTSVAAELLTRCRFPERDHYSCAVSGGADSLALLVLATETGRPVTAIHVDHGLRPASADEAEVVRRACERFGASFRAETVTVEPGPNLEARARVARYGRLPAETLTGHTADDQAETVLLNLMRGAALDGLAGMDPRNRPLLGMRRHETRELCLRLGLDPVEDPTNCDPRFRRNRLRAEVLPLLDEIAARDVAPVIARQAELLRELADWLRGEAATIDGTDTRALAAAPRALARVAIRDWLRTATGAAHPVSSGSVDRVLNVVEGQARATEVDGGWTVRRRSGRLTLEPPAGR